MPFIVDWGLLSKGDFWDPGKFGGRSGLGMKAHGVVFALACGVSTLAAVTSGEGRLGGQASAVGTRSKPPSAQTVATAGGLAAGHHRWTFRYRDGDR